MSLIIIANFKSHKNKDEVNEWVSKIDAHPTSKLLKILLAPSYSSFPSIKSANINLCGQDVSPFPPGAYTGAVNSSQLKELQVKYCIIGHSERRRYFHESDQEIANKAELLLDEGITPIICLDSSYINSQISALSDAARSQSLFAYEPAEDIGGTEAAPNDQIQSTFTQIQKLLNTQTPLIYGGSVNPDNVNELLKLTNLQGFIISTSSLDPSTFIELLTTASHG